MFRQILQNLRDFRLILDDGDYPHIGATFHADKGVYFVDFGKKPNQSGVGDGGRWKRHGLWLGFVQPTGLVVSAPALVRTGAILDRRDTEGQRLLRESLDPETMERISDQAAPPYGGTAARLEGSGGGDLVIRDFAFFARRFLGWSGFCAGRSQSTPTKSTAPC